MTDSAPTPRRCTPFPIAAILAALAMLLGIAPPASAAALRVDSVRTLPGDTTAVDSSRSIGATIVADLGVIVEDGVAFFTAPARFGPLEWGMTAAVVGGTLGLLNADEAVRGEVKTATYGPVLSTLLTRGSDFGEVIYANIFTAATYLTGLIAGSDAIRVTGRLLAESLLYSGAVTMSLRYLLGRKRPNRSPSAWAFEGFQTSNELQSLPSGHTTVAFALASVLADRVAHPAATVLFYTAASLTGLSRLYLDRHWASDVFLGAAIGTVAGLFVSRREDARSSAPASPPPQPTGEFRIAPTLNGLTMTYRW
jgi:membrane-associated phospholipid phosphatase